MIPHLYIMYLVVLCAYNIYAYINAFGKIYSRERWLLFEKWVRGGGKHKGSNGEFLFSTPYTSDC
jgi:hypothetical protein